MKILLVLISLYMISGCNSGLVKGDIHENVKADNWNRKDLVTTVQVSLNELGYETGNTDGIESEKTLDAVKQYKIDHGLEVSSTIDGNLESHIDDFIWKTRNEKSIDPKSVAKVIVQNRHEEACARLLGENYRELPFPSNLSNNAEIYIYRINNASGVKPDYPGSVVSMNSEVVGRLEHNEYMKLEVQPGEYDFTEEESDPLEVKQSTKYTFTVGEGETYFLNLSVGKITVPSTAETSPPFYIGYGVLDILVGELVWDIQNSHKYGGIYHFSTFIESQPHIGKCHINILNSL